jgi:hypothetical protein
MLQLYESDAAADIAQQQANLDEALSEFEEQVQDYDEQEREQEEEIEERRHEAEDPNVLDRWLDEMGDPAVESPEDPDSEDNTGDNSQGDTVVSPDDDQPPVIFASDTSDQGNPDQPTPPNDYKAGYDWVLRRVIEGDLEDQLPRFDEKLLKNPFWQGAQKALQDLANVPRMTVEDDDQQETSWLQQIRDALKSLLGVFVLGLAPSQTLGSNLRAKDEQPNPGDHAHHIVPEGSQGTDLPAARDKLEKLEIRINDAENGVWLPGNVNQKLNNSLYNDMISRAILEAPNDKEAVLEVLREIKFQLRTNPSQYFAR